MVTASKPKPGMPTRPTAKTESWYTREDVLDLLGISEHTITNWMRKGILNPIRETRWCKDGREHDVWVFDPKELVAAPTPRRRGREEPSAGEIAAKAFDLFNDGAKQRDVVVATNAEPEKIRELHETWLEMGGADFVITPAARIDIEKLLGPIGDIAELVEKLRAKLPELGG
jgi:Helix-turn-helix domain